MGTCLNHHEWQTMQASFWNSSWPATLLNGTCSITLPDLNIRQNGEIRHRGSGILHWQKGGKILVEAVTDGGPLKLDGAVRGRPGDLVPREEFASVEGTTLDGWDVSTIPLPLDGREGSNISPHFAWKFETFGLQMTKTRVLQSEPMLTAILGPAFDRGTRYTETSVQNFRTTHPRSLNWVQVETQFGTMHALRHSEDWFEVEIFPSSEAGEFNPAHFLKGVATAFSFVIGKRVQVLGHEFDQYPLCTRTLRVQMNPTPRRHLLKPFMHQLELTQLERCLEKAIRYFMTEEGDKAAGHFHLCWDTADNDILTKTLCHSVAIEGLVRLAASKGAEINGTLEPKIACVTKFLNDQQTELGKQFVNRLTGCMSAFKHARPVESLNKWLEAGLLNVQKEDISAWKQLRNAIAHASADGFPKERSEKQDFLRKLQRVQSLMNRIILQLIGFDGEYTDYNQPYPSPAMFPLADPSQL